MKAVVSIIMAAFNAEKFIAEAIQSILDQSYPYWELIVVNDGSTDKTEEVVLGIEDRRIQIHSQINQGVSAARNTGLSKIAGEYFTFLDADDIMPRKSLESRMMFAQSRPSADFIAGYVEFFSSKGKGRIWRPNFKGNPTLHFALLDETVFCNPSFLIRYDPLVTYRFKAGMTHVEDLLFFLTIAIQKSTTYDYVEETVYRYRVSENSAMSNLLKLEEGYQTFYSEVKKMHILSRRQQNHLLYRIKRIMFLSFLNQKQVKNAVRVLIKSF